jgi:hypothetical protein
MIDITNKYGILNLSVRSADFLCQNSPVVCAVEPNRSSDRRRKGAFLLEENMPKGIKGFQKGHKKFGNGGFKKGFTPWNKGKHPEYVQKENHHSWKGGRHLNIHTNRLWIYKPEHPFALDKYVVEYRLIMEDKIGRYLKFNEVVHHINGNPSDNRIENLQLMTRADHTKLHSKIKSETRRLTVNKNKEGV